MGSKRTNLMSNRFTLHITAAKFVVCSHTEGVLEPCCEGADVEGCLRGVSQVAVWNVQFSWKYTLGCSHDDLCELHTPSVCVTPADGDHTTRGSGRSWAHRSRDWEQRETQSSKMATKEPQNKQESLVLCPGSTLLHITITIATIFEVAQIDGAFKELLMTSHLNAFCAWDTSPHFPVSPAQLMRPGIGRNAS